MRAFHRVYYVVAALTIAAASSLPWLVALSYRTLGFDPALAGTETAAAVQAHRATAPLRREFVSALLLLALSLAGLSLVAIVLRARRRSGIPWPVLVASMAGAIGVAVVALSALVAGGSGMCC